MNKLSAWLNKTLARNIEKKVSAPEATRSRRLMPKRREVQYAWREYRGFWEYYRIDTGEIVARLREEDSCFVVDFVGGRIFISLAHAKTRIESAFPRTEHDGWEWMDLNL